MGAGMSDFKELISNLLFLAKYCHENYNELFVDDELKKAAEAIEQLVKERNEALNRLSWEEEARFERERERMLESCRNGDVYL